MSGRAAPSAPPASAVLCAACGATFEPPVLADEVACGLCGERVRLGSVERRRERVPRTGAPVRPPLLRRLAFALNGTIVVLLTLGVAIAGIALAAALLGPDGD